MWMYARTSFHNRLLCCQNSSRAHEEVYFFSLPSDVIFSRRLFIELVCGIFCFLEHVAAGDHPPLPYVVNRCVCLFQHGWNAHVETEVFLLFKFIRTKKKIVLVCRIHWLAKLSRRTVAPLTHLHWIPSRISRGRIKTLFLKKATFLLLFPLWSISAKKLQFDKLFLHAKIFFWIPWKIFETKKKKKLILSQRVFFILDGLWWEGRPDILLSWPATDRGGNCGCSSATNWPTYDWKPLRLGLAARDVLAHEDVIFPLNRLISWENTKYIEFGLALNLSAWAEQFYNGNQSD